MLIGLALNEPGKNWPEEEFQHNRETPSMPGWTLNDTWKTDAGVPPEGIISVTYFSGDGTQVDECAPEVPFRKALTNLVLVNEEECVTDEEKMESVLAGDTEMIREKPGSAGGSAVKPASVGIKFITDSPSKFDSYALPAAGFILVLQVSLLVISVPSQQVSIRVKWS
jgi:hypothetical protein